MRLFGREMKRYELTGWELRIDGFTATIYPNFEWYIRLSGPWNVMAGGRASSDKEAILGIEDTLAKITKGLVFAQTLEIPGTERDRDRATGQAVLPGTRFPVSRLIGELSEGKETLEQIVQDQGLNLVDAKDAVMGVATSIEADWRWRPSLGAVPDVEPT